MNTQLSTRVRIIAVADNFGLNFACNRKCGGFKTIFIENSLQPFDQFAALVHIDEFF